MIYFFIVIILKLGGGKIKMFNKKIWLISILFIILFIPNVFSEVKQITSSNQNKEQTVSTELLISTTIKKEFNLVYENIKSDMMEEIENSKNYADEQIESASAKLTYYYLKVIISLALINLISIIFAQFIVFKLRAKEFNYLQTFNKNVSINNNKKAKEDINNKINEISDDLNKLNEFKNKDTIPKPVFEDEFVSIDKL